MDNPWKNLPDAVPYVLEQDRYVIHEINYKYGDSPRKIQTQLMPEPFIGNIEAPIIILTKNPGFDKLNDPFWHTQEKLQRLARINLFQEPSDYPFYFLNPEIHHSPGAVWHREKLRTLINKTSLIKVAQNICSIPSFPYHTSQYSGIPKRISKEVLPSQRYTRFIVLMAIERNDIIVLGSGKNEWETLVPELFNYQKTYFLRNSQRPYISPGNLNQFAELLDVIS